MKPLLLLLLLALGAHAQGLVGFYNRNLLDPETQLLYNAPVTLPDGTGAQGSTFTAGLFLSQSDSWRLIATTSFHEMSYGAGFFARPQVIEVPDLPPGSPAILRARVWETAAGSYENAVIAGRYHGEFLTKSGSADIFIPYLGSPNPPGGGIMPDISGIQPLNLVPEPQSFALATFGGFLLLAQKLFRRKR